MKYLILFIFFTSFFFSCKKEEQYNPDEHIVYTHWYKLKSNSVDTLYSMYIPNAITPNGDETNDEFYPTGYIYGASHHDINYSLEIFSNQNITLFKTTDPNKHWNGCYNNDAGNRVGLGSYTYQLKITNGLGSYDYEGSVLVIY